MYIVSGATGNTGSAVAKTLLEKGLPVRVIVRSEEKGNSFKDLGADVTVFSTSPSKQEDAKKLGAHNFVVTKDAENLKALAGQFDFILDCVSAEHDLNAYLNLLKLNGAMVIVGVLEKPAPVQAFSLIANNRTLAGSGIGGIRETQEMLDYCAENNITSDIEIIPIQQIEAAYERTVKGDVRYRFVIDMKSLDDEKA